MSRRRQDDELQGARAARRAPGELEAEVLGALWRSDRPLTAAALRAELGDDLASTTVMTILSRLDAKGLVSREPAGRSFAYSALVAPAELTARRMREVLAAGPDHDAVLQQFVAGLDGRDEARLRRLLRDADGRRG